MCLYTVIIHQVLSDRVCVREMEMRGGRRCFPRRVVWLVVSHCQFQTNVGTWSASSSVQLTSSDFFVCVIWYIAKKNLLLIIPEFPMEVQQKSALGRSAEVYVDQSYSHLLDFWDVYPTGPPNVGYISKLTYWIIYFRLLNLYLQERFNRNLTNQSRLLEM